MDCSLGVRVEVEWEVFEGDGRLVGMKKFTWTAGWGLVSLVIQVAIKSKFAIGNGKEGGTDLCKLHTQFVKSSQLDSQYHRLVQCIQNQNPNLT
jgi:hypothetical protein